MATLMAMFGLDVPILQATTAVAAGPDVTIAVSNAGGLGGIGLTWAPDAKEVVAKIRAATTRLFVVNMVLDSDPTNLSPVLEAGAPIIQFSWGMPSREMVAAIRANKARFGVQVTSAGSAREAIALGADYLVCQGTEAGGHVQAHLPLLVALPEVLSVAGSTPVAASGGIGNGRDVRRVLVAGAAGAVLGTRFVATKESAAHPEYKAALARARAADTVLTVCFDGGWPNAHHRVLRNATFERWESAGCPPAGKRPGEGDIVATRPPDKHAVRYSTSSPSALATGAVTEMALYAGEGVEHIRDIPPAGELVARLWAECLAAG